MNNKNNVLAAFFGRLSPCVAGLMMFAVAGCTLSDKADAPVSSEIEVVVPAEVPAAGTEVPSAGEVPQEAAVPAPAPVPEVLEPEGAPAPDGESPVLPVRGDVVWIQQRLKELGYYAGPIDGRVGTATRNAIRAYQSDQQLPQDGMPTPALQDFMWRNGG